MDPQAFYAQLFRSVEEQFGKLDEDTLTSVVGFTAGGPVSLCSIEEKGFYVTCELALNPKQVTSTEGLRFELASHGSFDLDTCREVMTALADLSLGSELGDGHRVGVSGAYTGTIALRLQSQTEIDGLRYGVYVVEPSA